MRINPYQVHASQVRQEHPAHIAYCWRQVGPTEQEKRHEVYPADDSSVRCRLSSLEKVCLDAGAPRPLPAWASPGSGLPGATPGPARKRRRTAAALDAVFEAVAALPPPVVSGASRVSAPEQPNLAQRRGRTPFRRGPGRPPRSLLANRPIGRSSVTAVTQVQPDPANLEQPQDWRSCVSTSYWLPIKFQAILRQRYIDPCCCTIWPPLPELSAPAFL